MSDKRLTGAIRDLSPCIDCSERHTACHASCPRYKAWKAEAQRVKNARSVYLKERNLFYEEQERRRKWELTASCKK